MPEFRRVFVIQCKSSGHFLTESLRYTLDLSRAGRLTDPEEALDTAIYNLEDDYKIHAFYEQTEVPE